MLGALDTPCPVTRPHNNLITSFYDEETAEIEYTTAFHASFRNVPPKRRQRTHAASDFVIHEDVGPKQAPGEHTRPRLTQPAKRKILPHTATREDNTNLETNSTGSSGKPNIDTRDAGTKRKPAMARSRRDNVYIPSEDTTQPTMWMGIFSPVKHQVEEERSLLSPTFGELTGIAARMAEKRKAPTVRRSAAIVRTPLGLNTTAQDHGISGPDQPGEPTGKENLPPGFMEVSISRDQDKHALKSSMEATYRRLGNDPHARLSHTPKKILPPHRPATTTNPHQKQVSTGQVQKLMPVSKIGRKQKPVKRTISPKVPKRFVEKLALPASQYPQVPLLEDIDQPQMYEVDWINHQESAMSQLLNSIFETAEDKAGRSRPQDELRASLLSWYTSSVTSAMHNRMQTAVSSGVLSLSRIAAINVEALNNDIGRRKAFLDFWLNCYNHELLQVALEVVVGRQVCLTSSQGFENIKWTPSSRRIALRLFIEAFLLRNEDATATVCPKVYDSAMAARILLRSLMVVRVLDMVKNSFPHDPRLLFRRSSTSKCSIDAVQSVLGMLSPTAGDQVRALRSLGYTVSHEQHARDELVYRVKNLAVDLRDGVLLTRLVEILLYSQPSTEQPQALVDDEVTVLMPEGDTITVDCLGSSRLVHHLRVPATSRALKLWNVQIALGALQQIDGISSLLSNIHAEHIVDGHREMSIKLLWSLVSKFGLPSVLDWSDIKHEILRLNSAQYLARVSRYSNPPSQAQCEDLLIIWAESVASAHNLPATNLSSTITSGRYFEAILDEYEPHLTIPRDQQASTLDLCERLQAIGCNKPFANLFATTSIENSSTSGSSIHILSQDFNLMALSFLASRLLGATKLSRSALRIQRAWREYWNRILCQRMVKRKEIARACAAAVAGAGAGALKSSENESGNGNEESVAGNRDGKTGGEDDIWLSLDR